MYVVCMYVYVCRYVCNVCMYVCMYVRTYKCMCMYVHTYVVLTCVIKFILTPCSRFLLEKLTVPQLVKKFPAFYGTSRSITAITKCSPPVPILSKQVYKKLFILRFKVV